MEKMNQVSVTEFMSKSKEEMYDMAVEMVEKYNRLVDICNDSAERMADLIVRHKVYTDALKNDIASKDAKIEKLEKEIEGRKECYTALKELMDTKYISIDEHNNIVDPLNKEIERLNIYTANQKKVNHDLVTKVILLESEKEENEKLKEEVKNLKNSVESWVNEYNCVKCQYETEMVEEYNSTARINRLTSEIEKLKVDLIHEREKNEKLAKDHAELENDIRKYTTEIKKLEEKVKHQRENLDGINKTLEIKIKENESLIAVRNNLNKEIEAHESENARLSEKIMSLKGTITELSHEIDNYKSWNASLHKDIKELKKERDKHMARVNDLRMELDCVKASKEKHEDAAHEKVVEGLRENIKYWRTKYLATQEERDALQKEVDELKKKEDDHGRAGFEEYIKHIIEEEEGKFKGELNKRFSEEVSKISQKRTEEELAKAKLNDKFGYAREIAFRIRSEVDKKRIVDIGEGAEKILGVSRELFDAAIKALVDDGYQEIIGRIPQATNSYVYMDMHVLATPDVETRETANAENIKSLDFGIPCGEDAIE